MHINIILLHKYFMHFSYMHIINRNVMRVNKYAKKYNIHPSIRILLILVMLSLLLPYVDREIINAEIIDAQSARDLLKVLQFDKHMINNSRGIMSFKEWLGDIYSKNALLSSFKVLAPRSTILPEAKIRVTLLS